MTPFSTRGAVAMTGAFGYELNLLALSDEEKNLVKEQIQFYKSHQTLFRTGNYFRLTNPFENHNYTAWQYVSEDQRKAAIFFVLLRNECNKPVTLLRLQGLIPEAQYRIGNNIYSGSALMYGGIPIHTLDKDYESAVWDLEIID